MSDQATKDAFSVLVRSNAWQRLEAWVAHEVDSSIRLQDAKPADELNLGTVCEERGIRKGMMRVIQEAKGKAEGR